MKILEAFLVSTPTHLAQPSPYHSLSPVFWLTTLAYSQSALLACPPKLYQVLRMKYILKNTAHLVHTF